jgi:exopolysaccharide biosynthesis WecB/TagA/CpsF family protein
MIELIRRMNCYDSIEKCAADIVERSNSGCTVVSFLNAHAVNLAYEDSDFRECLLSSTFVLRDGVGVEIACSVMSEEAGSNMNGTDLIPLILDSFSEKGGNIYFFGGTQEAIDRLSNIYKSNNVVRYFFLNGFLEDVQYLEMLERTMGPRNFLVIGMGMPKQEILAKCISDRFIESNIVVANGGAIIDRLSGMVSRGPILFRWMKIEWLYRLILSPRRLFKRYVLGNPLFLYRLFCLKFYDVDI